jgi:hypothetical protein
MTLIKELTELYWALGEYSIDDERRMKAVVREIAQVIRTWAPPESRRRICHLAINEVADRLLTECNDNKCTAPTATSPLPRETTKLKSPG